MYNTPQSHQAFDCSSVTLKLYEGASLGPKALIETLSMLFSSQKLSLNERSVEWRQDLAPKPDTVELLGESHDESSVAWQLLLTPEGSHICLPLDSRTELVLSSEDKQLDAITQDSSLIGLQRHIGQALLLCHRITRQKQENQSISDVLDHYPIPALVVDNQLNSIYANKMARRKFLQSPQIDSSNKLDVLRDQARDHLDILKICDSNSQRIALKGALKRCALPLQTESALCRITVEGDDYPLVISPTESVPDLFKHYARSAVAWVYILDASLGEHLRNNNLFLSLDLSNAEKELCILLIEGKLLSEIALFRRVSEQTVRKQLQSILRKHNLESQEALIIFLFENYIEYGLIK